MTRRNFIKWLIAAVWASILTISILPMYRRFREDADRGRLRESMAATQQVEVAPTEHPIEVAAGPLLSFFIISDLHVNSGISSQSSHLRKALDDIKTFGDKAQAIIITGDITDTGTPADYKEYKNIMSQYNLPPVYANMGNHDYYNVWIGKNGAWSQDTFPNGKKITFKNLTRITNWLIVGHSVFQSLVILMRILVGFGWLLAGVTKITGKAWFSEPGVFLTDYLLKAYEKTDVPDFYKYFIHDFVLNHVMFFNYIIAITQVIAGIFLIFGFMTIPSILVCLFIHINFIQSGNMNLTSLTLYTSAFGLLLCRKWMYFFSLDRYLELKSSLQKKSNSVHKMPMFIGWIMAALLLASSLYAPKVETIQTYPIAADEFGTVLLPNGSGTLHIEAHVKNVQSVYFWRTHMELGAEEDRQLLYEDSNGSDGWAVDFPMTRMRVFLIS